MPHVDAIACLVFGVATRWHPIADWVSLLPYSDLMTYPTLRTVLLIFRALTGSLHFRHVRRQKRSDANLPGGNAGDVANTLQARNEERSMATQMPYPQAIHFGLYLLWGPGCSNMCKKTSNSELV